MAGTQAVWLELPQPLPGEPLHPHQLIGRDLSNLAVGRERHGLLQLRLSVGLVIQLCIGHTEAEMHGTGTNTCEPEPSSLMLLSSGLIGAAGMFFRRRVTA